MSCTRSSARLPAVLAVVVSAIVAGGAPASARPAATAQVAPGAPGALSHFDLARKDCVGTARNDTSKVWFTVADGVLSDVYEPTIDTTNVETMQFVVTDGRTFTDLQTRDATYSVTADPTGMACTVTTTARSRAWRLVTTYVTDPARDSVLVRTRLHGLRVPARDLHLYTRLDPTVGGHGGGGTDNAGADGATTDGPTGALVTSDPTTLTAAVNRDYAVPTSLALRADRPFRSSTNGYAGTPSDGLAQLDAEHHLTDPATDAPGGNVVGTAEVDLRHGTATLALGFGRTADEAVATAGASLARDFDAVQREYLREWLRYDAGLRVPPARLPGLSRERAARLRRAYYLSVNVVKASEDKTFPGAAVASLGSPWGQAVPAGNLQDGRAPYFGSYREVFSRDLYESFTALLAAGDVETAQATTRFLFERQQLPDGRMPRNSLVNGKVAPDTGGDQLDETAYPILMALQSGLDDDAALYRDHIRKAADFVVAHGPAFGNERWEEQSGYSPSTIAAEISGLVAAARIAAGHGDTERADVYLATADHFQRSIKGWTVTTTGPYAPGRYFVRLSKTGDPNAGVAYNLGNGGPTVDERTVVDGGFQELTRLGILPADDPDVRASLPVVDAALSRTTPTGPGWYRYGTATEGTEDGYGDCHVPDPTDCAVEGQPWPTGNRGSGHLWPVLAGERAEQRLQTGDPAGAAALLDTMDRTASGVGMVPEQTWENPAVPRSPYGSDPATASIGLVEGGPAGSAAPLTWAQSQLARLVLSIPRGRPIEQPAEVRARYVDNPAPGAAPVAVTAPVAGSVVTTSTTDVTGTTVAGGRVVVAATNTDAGTTTVVATTAGPDGTFGVTVPTAFGTTVLTTAIASGSTTGYDQRAVSSDAIGGTVVLDVTDPAGDDHGPGTFQPPTAPDFHDGAFDLTRFQVVQDGDTTFLRAGVRDLAPTFGNPLGAQLLTVFVHRPGVDGSTSPLLASRNHSVADADAWARAIQVRGFDETRVFDASGGQIGTAGVQASEPSGFITVRVPTALVGAVPGPGWTFTVVLHGQDGFGQDGARTFADTPQPFQFGRCATAGDPDPRCAVPLDQLPKAMDVLVPAGTTQAEVLDPTRPVVLRGIPVP